MPNRRTILRVFDLPDKVAGDSVVNRIANNGRAIQIGGADMRQVRGHEVVDGLGTVRWSGLLLLRPGAHPRQYRVFGRSVPPMWTIGSNKRYAPSLVPEPSWSEAPTLSRRQLPDRSFLLLDPDLVPLQSLTDTA